ncbi:MAG: hypothetical protein V1735_02650 [Nanoarchaeota archaeon]
MAMFSFGKKDAPPADVSAWQPPPQPQGVPPVNDVLQMRQQGFSNNQIIQRLQQQGFAPNVIFDAMNQADVKGNVEGIPAMTAPPPGMVTEGGYAQPPPEMQGFSPQGSSEERI